MSVARAARSVIAGSYLVALAGTAHPDTARWWILVTAICALWVIPGLRERRPSRAAAAGPVPAGRP